MNKNLIIALGADHHGNESARVIARWLAGEGHRASLDAVCESASCDYPDKAFMVASTVAHGDADFGLLICGSGIGMSMAANKVDGVRAALVHDACGAEMSRRHNNANVLCMSKVDAAGDGAIEIVRRFITTDFEGGRHERRVAKMAAIECGKDPATAS